MVSIQEVIDSLNQKLDTQQGIHQSPPPGPSMPHASSFMLHGQSRLAPPVIAQTTVSEDVHALMDHLEQQIRQIRDSEDLAQEFIPQFAFNTGVDVSKNELNTLKQGSDESISYFISRWRESLFSVEDGLARGLWPDFFPIDSKGKKPSGEQRPNVSTISPTKQRTFRRHQSPSHAAMGYYPYSRYQYRQSIPPQHFDWTYSYFTLPRTGYATRFIGRPSTSIPRAKPPQSRTSFAPRIS
ncbi:hypothetical protein CK203_102556 [Vitis vinifera]|uniref:Uncharacterized protein n=1 Tax=Vitis vinifera TaxID=29760 RepID=A0A438D178_VITVI|nr:hypothetical protein CK203_102556 [Vitis vinifera]